MIRCSIAFQILMGRAEIAHVMPKDDPLAGGAAFPRRPRVDLEGGLSQHRRVYEDLARPTARRSRRSTTPAAAICSSTTLSGPISARRTNPTSARARRGRRDLQEIYARMINYAIAERPADMTITTHVCRGNFRSTWISSGGYEPVAETLLGGHQLRRLFPRRRFRARRRLRAAALPAEGQEDRRGRPHHLQERPAREQGRHQAAAGGGVKIRPARSVCAIAAMRLRVH